ncbi:MAG: hypothetical protein KOO60_11255 [Gemmatimonadales bacterium]|nr:hypothetical protein [Gemmatimonadales bacterium]
MSSCSRTLVASLLYLATIVNGAALITEPPHNWGETGTCTMNIFADRSLPCFGEF